MKITSFDPMIITDIASNLITLFEDLGFERTHNKVGDDFLGNRMKHPDGFHVDIVDAATPQTLTTIRMNVDDFDEAYELLTSRGFTVVQGGSVTDTGSSRSVMMVSPSGFTITIVKHIK